MQSGAPLRPPGHRQSIQQLPAAQQPSTSPRPSMNSKPRSSQRAAVDPVKVLPGLLRSHLDPLDSKFASSVAHTFRLRAGDVPGARLGFEDTIAGLRALGLEDFVDGAHETAGVDLGDGGEARRQLRLWSGSGQDFGVTDEQSFTWIAYRGDRFKRYASMKKFRELFSKLSVSGNGVVSLSSVMQVLAAEEAAPADTISMEEVRADVIELFKYHSARDDSIEFPDFIALTCDIQDRSALGRLSHATSSPVPCVLKRDCGVTFLRPAAASDFLPLSQHIF